MSFRRSANLSSVAVAASLGLVLTLVPASQAQRAPDRAAGDTLFPGQGNSGYDVRSYDVRLRYQPSTNHLSAVTTIAARAAHPLSSYSLDLVGMRVAKVVVNGHRATFDRVGHKLVVHPAVPARWRFWTTVTYAGKPREHLDPDGSTEGWVRTTDGATALGEPIGAMTWLPSNNTPGDKATYTFRVTAPSAVKVAANGVLVGRRWHGGQTTWTWRETDQMATYLATVSIGKYDLHRSSMRSLTGRTIPIWSFVDPTVDPSVAARRALPSVIRFEERRFGPYPFTATGMIVDDADVGYALETQGRPFYPLGTDTATLVHEMAHQWYGDSVTLVDWHDIWLAEGFATYAEWMWDSTHGGGTPAARFDRLYETPDGSDLWHPAPTRFTDPADLFGKPVYTRGAMTLQVLRGKVGGPAFFRILRAWARERRHANARTAQFVALAERVSGQQLDQMFADWLTLDGKPAGY
jgi:aminopeptidase N